MKTDAELRDDVEAELEWDPSFDSRNIGVAAKNGVVTLSGHVRSYADRWAAQNAAQRVTGVKAIANEIEVRLPGDAQRSDTDIAQDAVLALSVNVAVPVDDVKVVVRDGWLSLFGEVEFWYQKTAAEAAVRYLRGVKGISSSIKLKPTAKPAISAADIKVKIESAFQRHAHRDALGIRIDVKNGTVTLEGSVPTWQERHDAEVAAWSAPGVFMVEDRLVIQG